MSQAHRQDIDALYDWPKRCITRLELNLITNVDQSSPFVIFQDFLRSMSWIFDIPDKLQVIPLIISKLLNFELYLILIRYLPIIWHQRILETLWRAIYPICTKLIFWCCFKWLEQKSPNNELPAAVISRNNRFAFPSKHTW